MVRFGQNLGAKVAKKLGLHEVDSTAFGDRGRWYLFDPTELAPRNQVTRIGTGRDATDVAFATIFGTAQMTGMNPTVTILEQGVEDVAAAVATA